MPDLTACVLLALLSTSLANLGLGLQKAGADWMRRFQAGRLAVWVAGVLMGIAAPFALAAALDRGPASLVSALGAFGLVPLYLFAALVLKEPITRAHGAALAAVMVGVGWLGLQGVHHGTSADTFQAENLLRGAVATLLLPVVSVALAAWTRSRLLGLALGCLAGTFSGLALIVLKVGALTDAWWASGGGWVAVSALSFLVLQVAWRHGNAVQIVPSSTAFALMVPVALAPACFGEPLTPWLLGGMGAIAMGVALLALGESRREAQALAA